MIYQIYIFFRHQDKIFYLALALFSILFIPFLSAIPYMDGDVDFTQVYNFYHGGFEAYFRNWQSVHAPLKIITGTIFFKLFGVNVYSYTIVGFLFGIAGVIGIYLLAKQLFGKTVAQISALFLATSPLFLANGLFWMRDYMITVFILWALYFYSQKKYIFYSVASTLAVLAKEPALLLPISVVVVEILFNIKTRVFKEHDIQIKKIMALLLPFFVIAIWWTFILINGSRPWQDSLIPEKARQGIYLAIITNLLTFQFLNIFTYMQSLQLFFLNFNWVFFSIIMSTVFFTLYNHSFILKVREISRQHAKVILVVLFFCITYIFTVLTLQIFPLPRYELPLFPFLYMATALCLKKIGSRFQVIKIELFLTIPFIVFLSLFFSLDPISRALWRRTTSFQQELYGVDLQRISNDSLTYNLQALMIAKKRTHFIQSISHSRTSTKLSCITKEFIYYVNNDTLKKLGIIPLNTRYLCATDFK